MKEKCFSFNANEGRYWTYSVSCPSFASPTKECWGVRSECATNTVTLTEQRWRTPFRSPPPPSPRGTCKFCPLTLLPVPLRHNTYKNDCPLLTGLFCHWCFDCNPMCGLVCLLFLWYDLVSADHDLEDGDGDSNDNEKQKKCNICVRPSSQVELHLRGPAGPPEVGIGGQWLQAAAPVPVQGVPTGLLRGHRPPGEEAHHQQHPRYSTVHNITC